MLTKKQQAIAIHLLRKLESCWDSKGKTVEEYYGNIILPELSPSVLKTYKSICDNTDILPRFKD
jgi:hypothetical protein